MNTHHSRAALVACLLVLGVASAMAQTTNVRNTAWVLSSMPGRALIVGASPTLQFDTDRVSGTDGCNRFTAPYYTTSGWMQIGSSGEGSLGGNQVAVSTQMACSELVSIQAKAFMNSLTRARSYRLGRGQLELISEDGGLLATLARQPTTLAGTSWLVNSYNTGKQAVVGVMEETTLTMAFGADGRVSGSSGCNTYTGAYTSHGGALKFGPAAATRRMCVHPESIMEQEQLFLKALEMVATSGFDADRLDLRTAEGELVISLQRDLR